VITPLPPTNLGLLRWMTGPVEAMSLQFPAWSRCRHLFGRPFSRIRLNAPGWRRGPQNHQGGPTAKARSRPGGALTTSRSLSQEINAYKRERSPR